MTDIEQLNGIIDRLEVQLEDCRDELTAAENKTHGLQDQVDKLENLLDDIQAMTRN